MHLFLHSLYLVGQRISSHDLISFVFEWFEIWRKTKFILTDKEAYSVFV